MKDYLFTSSRLGFRNWRPADLPAFTALNQDPQVMEFFPGLLSPEQTEQFHQRLIRHFDEHGFTFYATDLLESGRFIGFIGFARATFESFFTPCIEIGWRTLPFSWGKGLATEGARACLDYGFRELGFEEVYSFTAVANKRSERIMQKAGMEKVGEFGHPRVAEDSWLHRHVLYRLVDCR